LCFVFLKKIYKNLPEMPVFTRFSALAEKMSKDFEKFEYFFLKLMQIMWYK